MEHFKWVLERLLQRYFINKLASAWNWTGVKPAAAWPERRLRRRSAVGSVRRVADC